MKIFSLQILPSRHSRCRRAVLAMLFLVLTGCATDQSTRPGAVGIERKQTLWVSASEVNQASAQAYQEVVGKASRQGVLNRDSKDVARVRAIAERLIAASGAFRPDAANWKWEVNVIDSPDVNAWVMPGGKIAVYSGLIDKLQLTDDELAAVMGHEIAHALREHGRERASQAMATNLGLAVVGAAMGASKGQMDLAGLVTDLTINLPNSRGFETEADRVGVELAARAGYDPRAALSLWQKMTKASSGGAPPGWLSTHPSHEDRQKDLAEYSRRVLPLYQARKH